MRYFRVTKDVLLDEDEDQTLKVGAIGEFDDTTEYCEFKADDITNLPENTRAVVSQDAMLLHKGSFVEVDEDGDPLADPIPFFQTHMVSAPLTHVEKGRRVLADMGRAEAVKELGGETDLTLADAEVDRVAGRVFFIWARKVHFTGKLNR
jgi:hypothetical protein